MRGSSPAGITHRHPDAGSAQWQRITGANSHALPAQEGPSSSTLRGQPRRAVDRRRLFQRRSDGLGSAEPSSRRRSGLADADEAIVTAMAFSSTARSWRAALRADRSKSGSLVPGTVDRAARRGDVFTNHARRGQQLGAQPGVSPDRQRPPGVDRPTMATPSSGYWTSPTVGSSQSAKEPPPWKLPTIAPSKRARFAPRAKTASVPLFTVSAKVVRFWVDQNVDHRRCAPTTIG